MKLRCKMGFHKFKKSNYSRVKCQDCGFEKFIGITAVAIGLEETKDD